MAKIVKDAVEGLVGNVAKKSTQKIGTRVVKDTAEPSLIDKMGLGVDKDPVTQILNKEESNRYGSVMGRVNKDMDTYIDRTKRALAELDPRDTEMRSIMEQSIKDAQARKIGRRKDGSYGPLGQDVDTTFYNTYYDENSAKVMQAIQAQKKTNLKISDEKAKGLTDTQAKAKVEFNKRMADREEALKHNRAAIRNNAKLRSNENPELTSSVARLTRGQIQTQIAKGEVEGTTGKHIDTNKVQEGKQNLSYKGGDYTNPNYWEEMIELAIRSGNKQDLELASREYTKALTKHRQVKTNPDLQMEEFEKAGKQSASDKIDVVLGLKKGKRNQVSDISRAHIGNSWGNIERGGGMGNKAFKADVGSRQYRDNTVGTRTYTDEKEIVNNLINDLVEAEAKGQPIDDILANYYSAKSYNAPKAGQVTDDYIASKAKMLEDANIIKNEDIIAGSKSNEGDELITKIRASVAKDMKTQGITDEKFIDDVMARIQGKSDSLRTKERVNRVDLKTDAARQEFNRLVRAGTFTNTGVLQDVKDIKQFKTQLKRIDTVGDVEKLIKEIDDYATLNDAQKKRIASYAVRNTLKAHGTSLDEASEPVRAAVNALEDYKKSIDINSKSSTELLGKSKGQVNTNKEKKTYTADNVRKEYDDEISRLKSELADLNDPHRDYLYSSDITKKREGVQARLKELEEQGKYFDSSEPYLPTSRGTNYISKYRSQLAKDKDAAAKQAAKDAKQAEKDKLAADKLLAKAKKAEEKAKLDQQKKESKEKYGGKSWKQEKDEKLLKAGIGKQELKEADTYWDKGLLYPDEYLKKIDSFKERGILSNEEYDTRRASIQKAVDKINAKKAKN